MEKYVSVAEMQAIEREANESGLSYQEMMENAGTNLAFFVSNTYRNCDQRMVLALVGAGNNGGDALVALSKLQEMNWQTLAYIVKPRLEGDYQLHRYVENGGVVVYANQDPAQNNLVILVSQYKVLIDGVLGTGIRFPLLPDIAQVLRCVKRMVVENEGKPHVVAVDCPSGIDCDTGQASTDVIPAEVTYTMAAIKRGLFNFPAANLVGEVRVGGIGDLSKFGTWNSVKRGVVTDKDICLFLPSRPRDAHKGTFGTALLIAGAGNYPGAVLLAGSATYRSGAGLVKIAIPEYIYSAIVGELKEAIWVRLPHRSGWISDDAIQAIPPALVGVNALLVGPGLGLETTTAEFMSKLLALNLPSMVIDADGLKLLAKIPDWYMILHEQVILTPHPGEMSALTGISKDEIQLNRLEVAETYAHQWGKVVVLKGAYTIIADPGGNTAIIPVATPALARAGTGDVLAGLIVGLLAQGLTPFHAACTGAYIHGRAGLQAQEEQGNSSSVLAGDLLGMISKILSRYQN